MSDLMESTMSSHKTSNLFQVYLRLRPPQAGASASAERFLTVETSEDESHPTHITLNPPNDRRRAIEKFAFTQVFEEDATQLDIFHCTRVVPLVEGVLAPHGGQGTDALLATLGVTGSGKTHTILGSRTQRGLTQLALDVIFRSIGHNLIDRHASTSLEESLQASDTAESAVISAQSFLDSVYADPLAQSRGGSRAPTPMIVGTPKSSLHHLSDKLFQSFQTVASLSPNGVRLVDETAEMKRRQAQMPGQWPVMSSSPPPIRTSFRTPKRAAANKEREQKPYMALTKSTRVKNVAKTQEKVDQAATPRRLLQRPSGQQPQNPDVSSINVSSDPAAEYAVVISMYEVYNDRIFDLLTPPIRSNATKEYRRRPLLFKPTELSADRKVVAGLRKVICASFAEALMVLEAGLHERRVAGTGSNSTSSRSHGFFCIEVKKRQRSRRSQPWGGSALTIVDLAGSERARDAKTQGTTLAEAGKINESLMYLGQCLQMQSDVGNTNRPNIVPFRQCKLTELLFSNCFPSASSQSHSHRRNPQKAVMIVTADPVGDFNATSQILRYSALAREVTVPRIPSIFSNPASVNNTANQTMISSSPPLSSPTLSTGHRPFFAPPPPPGHHQGPGSGSGRGSGGSYHSRTFSPSSPHHDSGDRATMELAALEIARLTDEADSLRTELGRESDARVAAEAHLLSMEDRMLELEQAVREDCVAEFETRLAVELARWKGGLAVEMERGEEHWDRKIELFERGLDVAEHHHHDDVFDDDKENVLVENLEQENERLRRELGVLKRELQGRSPSRRAPLQERDDFVQHQQHSPSRGGGASSPGPDGAVGGLGARMERLRVSNESVASIRSNNGSPKKMRKMPARKWDSGVEDELLM